MADKVIDDTNVGRLVSDIKAKADATYWPISDTEEISLATVATSGSYNDLTDKPTAATGALIYVGTCATAAATATKVVTVETFPLQNSLPVKGTTIAVKFSNTNTASTPKLNVNSTGAINIYYNTASATGSSATYGGTANRYLYYFYDGTYWVWLGYGLDANDNTIGYNLRTNATRKTVSGACYRYRILFTSADGKQWVPSNTSTSTNATASRTVNQTKIDPWGPIAYYGTTTALSSGGAPAAAYLYEQYSSLTLGYSFNRTGAALTLTTQCPVWIKAAPQTDGSAIIDSTTPYVQSLPSTADGKIYILLGNAIAATTLDLLYTHPVYYYADGAIRIWTNPKSTSGIPAGGSQGQVLKKASGTDYDVAWANESGGSSATTYQLDNYYLRIAAPRSPADRCVLQIITHAINTYDGVSYGAAITHIVEFGYDNDEGAYCQFYMLGDPKMSAFGGDDRDGSTIYYSLDSEDYLSAFYLYVAGGTCSAEVTVLSGTAPSISVVGDAVSGETIDYEYPGTWERIATTNQIPTNTVTNVTVAGSSVVSNHTASLTNKSFGHAYGTASSSTVTISGATISAGSIITLKFNYDVSAHATLTINGVSGEIWHKGSTIQSGVINSGDVATFMQAGNSWNDYILLAVDTVAPVISTNITTDATSDTKAASPKAVKTYVDAQVGDIATLLAAI